MRGSDDGDRHVGAHEPVPGDEERLRVVAAGPAKLMMEVVVRCVVGEEEVKGVPREQHPGVVVDCLQRREGEESRRRPRRHARHGQRQSAAGRVQDEALGRVVVLRRVRVRRHQPVMPRMHVAVEEAVAVHQTVPEILPGVEHRHCHDELPRVHDDRRSRAGTGGTIISCYLRQFQTVDLQIIRNDSVASMMVYLQ